LIGLWATLLTSGRAAVAGSAAAGRHHDSAVDNDKNEGNDGGSLVAALEPDCLYIVSSNFLFNSTKATFFFSMFNSFLNVARLAFSAFTTSITLCGGFS
jgi:hypothetical protein